MKNNYFKAVVFCRNVERFTRFETFPFDDGDDDDTRRAWANVADFRMAQDRADLVVLSVWRPLERPGPWQFGVNVIGRKVQWLNRGEAA